MSSIGGRIVDLAGEPFLGGVVEDRPADGEALDDRRIGACGEGRLELASPALPGRGGRRRGTRDRCLGDDRSDLPPRRGGGLRFELPPVRLDAGGVELVEHPCRRVVAERAVLAGDDLDEQLEAVPPRGVVERAELLGLLGASAPRRRRDGRRRGT